MSWLTFESCDSLKLALLKSPSAMSAPEMSNVEASLPDIGHSRKSYKESRAAFAWPIAEEEKVQRFFFARSIGGKRKEAVCEASHSSRKPQPMECQEMSQLLGEWDDTLPLGAF